MSEFREALDDIKRPLALAFVGGLVWTGIALGLGTTLGLFLDGPAATLVTVLVIAPLVIGGVGVTGAALFVIGERRGWWT